MAVRPATDLALRAERACVSASHFGSSMLGEIFPRQFGEAMKRSHTIADRARRALAFGAACAALSCNGEPSPPPPTRSAQVSEALGGSGAQWTPTGGWPTGALVALTGVHVDKDVSIVGDVTVIDERWFLPEAVFRKNTSITGNVTAHRVWLGKGASVSGDVHYNQLFNFGTVAGNLITPLSLPVAVPTPHFPSIAPGTQVIQVASGTTQTLSAGSYGEVKLDKGSSSTPTVLSLSGGLYELSELTLKKNSRVLCTSPCELRVLEDIDLDKNATLGPAPGSGLVAPDIEVFVAGGAGPNHGCTGHPFRARKDSALTARVFAPNGLLSLDKSASVSGTLVACRIDIDKNSVIEKPADLCGNVDDGNPCTEDLCDPATGQVTHPPFPAGTDCDNGDLCDGSATCDGAGVCQAGPPPNCDDGNACTTDSCDPTQGCIAAPEPAGTSCSNNNACDGDETCDGAGSCQPGTPLSCDDGSVCTTDSCDPSAGCQNAPLPAGTPCENGTVCDGSELCDAAGVCQPGVPLDCNDDNGCTADSCEASSGCQNAPLPAGTSCADGDVCNGDETCNASATCQPGTPPVIDDNNPCTADACDPVTGVSHTPLPAGTSCADGDVCNGDETCDAAGTCQAGTPPPIDDNNPCTADACDPVTGVSHTPLPAGTACPDADLCNGDETCDATAICQAGTPPPVDDNNPCTADACDPITGVSHTPLPAGTACADGDLCNGDETCDASAVCQPGTPPVIDDNNPCTADACDPITGVSHTPLPAGTSCGDGDACNGDELCDAAGSCQAGTPPNCDDGSVCTTDSCDSTNGCVNTPLPVGTSCADGDVCNGDELCDVAGSCAAGTPLVVDDGNACTVDSCDPVMGVSHVQIPGCDIAPPISSGRFETRASLLGRLVDGSGSGINGATVTVFDGDTTAPPRNDVVLTTGNDGSFRARLTTFPESAPVGTPPHRVLVRVEAPGILPILREAYLRPGDVSDLGDLVGLARDSAVTMIGPAGGTATDSQGLFTLEFPPGAVANIVAVRITPIPDRKEFPFPLPDATHTGYGVVFEPADLAFALPVTVRVQNPRNLPTTVPLPVGFVNDDLGRWEHVGAAFWNGTEFESTISHFSSYDWNLGGNTGELMLFINEGTDPMHSPGAVCGGSSAAHGSGSLRQQFPLVSYQRQGQEYRVTLNYDSGLAGSVALGKAPDQFDAASLNSGMRVAIQGTTVETECVSSGGSGSGGGGCSTGSSCQLGIQLPLPAVNFEVIQKVFGNETQDSGSAAGGNLGLPFQGYIELPLNADGTVPAPFYANYKQELTLQSPLGGGVGDCAGGGGVFGVDNPDFVGELTNTAPGPLRVSEYALVYHRRASPYGVGWGISEINELYRSPDGGRVDLIHGDGMRETFRFRPAVTLLSEPTELPFGNTQTPMARDRATGENFLVTPAGTLYRINADGTLTSVFAGLSLPSAPLRLAVVNTSSDRRFAIATEDAMLEIDPAGLATTLIARTPTVGGSLGDQIERQPNVAAVGPVVFYTSGTDDLIQRVSLEDPTRTVSTISAAAPGDVKLDPTQPASGVFFDAPRGLAPSNDGGLYVATRAKNTVYKLNPEPGGTVGPNSEVVRVVGTGGAASIARMGSGYPGLLFVTKEPLQLVTTDSGRLLIVTRFGIAAYDPAEQTARWLALDTGVAAGGLTSFIFSGNGSPLALADDSVLLKLREQRWLLQIDFKLTSRYEPTRTADITALGATVTDTTANTIETYVWRDTLRQHALMTALGRRTGELLFSASYQSGSARLDRITDPTGSEISFSYDGSSKLSSISDSAGRTTQITVDSDGDLTGLTLPTNEARAFSYEFHRMKSATDPRGQVTQYTFADNGTLESSQRPGGGTLTYQAAFASDNVFDASGNVAYSGSYTDDRGVTHDLLINPAGQVQQDTFTADSFQYVTTNQYDNLNDPLFLAQPNRIFRVASTNINGLPVTPTTRYDSRGRAIEEENAVGSLGSFGSPQKTFAFSYDSAGFLSEVRPLQTNVRWSIDRDTNGRPTKIFDVDSVQNPTGRETLFTWRPRRPARHRHRTRRHQHPHLRPDHRPARLRRRQRRPQPDPRLRQRRQHHQRQRRDHHRDDGLRRVQPAHQPQRRPQQHHPVRLRPSGLRLRRRRSHHLPDHPRPASGHAMDLRLRRRRPPRLRARSERRARNLRLHTPRRPRDLHRPRKPPNQLRLRPTRPPRHHSGSRWPQRLLRLPDPAVQRLARPQRLRRQP